MADVAAGWHQDPRGEATYRWWDGERWTDHVSDGADSKEDEQAQAEEQATQPTPEPAPTPQVPAVTPQPLIGPAPGTVPAVAASPVVVSSPTVSMSGPQTVVDVPLGVEIRRPVMSRFLNKSPYSEVDPGNQDQDADNAGEDAQPGVVVQRNFMALELSRSKRNISRERRVAGDLPEWEPLPPGEAVVTRKRKAK